MEEVELSYKKIDFELLVKKSVLGYAELKKVCFILKKMSVRLSIALASELLDQF